MDQVNEIKIPETPLEPTENLKFPDLEPSTEETVREAVLNIEALMEGFLSRINVYKLQFENRKTILKFALIIVLISLSDKENEGKDQKHLQQIVVDALDFSVKNHLGLDAPPIQDLISQDQFEEIFDSIKHIICVIGSDD